MSKPCLNQWNRPGDRTAAKEIVSNFASAVLVASVPRRRSRARAQYRRPRSGGPIHHANRVGGLLEAQRIPRHGPPHRTIRRHGLRARAQRRQAGAGAKGLIAPPWMAVEGRCSRSSRTLLRLKRRLPRMHRALSPASIGRRLLAFSGRRCVEQGSPGPEQAGEYVSPGADTPRSLPDLAALDRPCAASSSSCLLDRRGIRCHRFRPSLDLFKLTAPEAKDRQTAHPEGFSTRRPIGSSSFMDDWCVAKCRRSCSL